MSERIKVTGKSGNGGEWLEVWIAAKCTEILLGLVKERELIKDDEILQKEVTVSNIDEIMSSLAKKLGMATMEALRDEVFDLFEKEFCTDRKQQADADKSSAE